MPPIRPGRDATVPPSFQTTRERIKEELSALKEMRAGSVLLLRTIGTAKKNGFTTSETGILVTAIKNENTSLLRQLTQKLYEDAGALMAEDPKKENRHLKGQVIDFRDDTYVLLSFLEEKKAQFTRMLRRESLPWYARAHEWLKAHRPDNKWDAIAYLGVLSAGAAGVIDGSFSRDFANGTDSYVPFGSSMSGAAIGAVLFARSTWADYKRDREKARTLARMLSEPRQEQIMAAIGR